MRWARECSRDRSVQGIVIFLHHLYRFQQYSWQYYQSSTHYRTEMYTISALCGMTCRRAEVWDVRVISHDVLRRPRRKNGCNHQTFPHSRSPRAETHAVSWFALSSGNLLRWCCGLTTCFYPRWKITHINFLFHHLSCCSINVFAVPFWRCSD